MSTVNPPKGLVHIFVLEQYEIMISKGRVFGSPVLKTSLIAIVCWPRFTGVLPHGNAAPLPDHFHLCQGLLFSITPYVTLANLISLSLAWAYMFISQHGAFPPFLACEC